VKYYNPIVELTTVAGGDLETPLSFQA
jgi:hypothetical protein